MSIIELRDNRIGIIVTFMFTPHDMNEVIPNVTFLRNLINIRILCNEENLNMKFILSSKDKKFSFIEILMIE